MNITYIDAIVDNPEQIFILIPRLFDIAINRIDR